MSNISTSTLEKYASYLPSQQVVSNGFDRSLGCACAHGLNYTLLVLVLMHQPYRENCKILKIYSNSYTNHQIRYEMIISEFPQNQNTIKTKNICAYAYVIKVPWNVQERWRYELIDAINSIDVEFLSLFCLVLLICVALLCLLLFF